MASRPEAVTLAIARFPEVARRFERVYGMRLPRHALFTAAFFLGLDDEERDAAWSLDAAGLFGVGEWFLEGALSKTPWADERAHGRFRRDPPELVSFVSGSSDGSHWGLWYDDPEELPRLCAHNWARDSAETAPGEATVMASVRERARETESWESAPEGLRSWLDEITELEADAHRDEAIAPAPSRPPSEVIVGGMCPVGVELPAEWCSSKALEERSRAYRHSTVDVGAWIDRAREELAAGRPGRALFLGRELHWVDRDEHRAVSTELLVGAYRALGRDALAGVVEAHHAARDASTVDAYAFTSSPIHLAAERGDADAVGRALSDPRLDSEMLRTLGAVARGDAVRALLFARDRRALDGALERALFLASPRDNAEAHEAGRRLAAARALGQSLESLMQEVSTARDLAVWRALQRYGVDLDVAAWRADAESLIEWARRLDGRVEPVLRMVLQHGLFDLAEALLPDADPRWLGPGDATLLHVAAGAACVEVTRALLDRGADPDARDARGQKPREWAREAERDWPEEAERVVAILDAAGTT